LNKGAIEDNILASFEGGDIKKTLLKIVQRGKSL